jgi:hypothetical protein
MPSCITLNKPCSSRRKRRPSSWAKTLGPSFRGDERVIPENNPRSRPAWFAGPQLFWQSAAGDLVKYVTMPHVGAVHAGLGLLLHTCGAAWPMRRNNRSEGDVITTMEPAFELRARAFATGCLRA